MLSFPRVQHSKQKYCNKKSNKGIFGIILAAAKTVTQFHSLHQKGGKGPQIRKGSEIGLYGYLSSF